MIRPALKWIGGKRALLPELLARMPSSYGTYYEPFCGGCALAFRLAPNRAVISDTNPELINFYKVVRDKLPEMLEQANRLADNKDTYYKIRNVDRDEDKFNALTDVERAVRFHYIKRNSFRALYRVNSKGQCNAAYGYRKGLLPIDADNLYEMSNWFNKPGISIALNDFEISLDKMNEGDFCYLDPPYFPVSKTASFTHYTTAGFTYVDQVRLLNKCKDLTERGIKFMVSNSYTKPILDLYHGFHIKPVETNLINLSKDYEHTGIEVIITNYEI